MKPVHNALFQSLIATSLLVAGFAEAQTFYQAPPAFDITIHTGMGTDVGSMQWSIAADPSGETGPNVLSELSYRDVKFSVFNASASVDIHRGWLRNSTLFMDYRAGQATSGEVQDSDYDGNNRTQEYSRSLSSAEDSSLGSLEIGISRAFQITEHTRLAPAVAYAHHYQNMVMTDGQQTIDLYNPANLGAFRGALNSSYSAEWNGAWAGVNWLYITRSHRLTLGYKQYWMDYHAEADWNLRSDFAHPKSFEHWAVGYGAGLDIQYEYQFSTNFSLSLSWFQNDWKTDPGEDRVYFADGTTGGSQLNEVTWKSTGYNMGLQLLF